MTEEQTARLQRLAEHIEREAAGLKPGGTLRLELERLIAAAEHIRLRLYWEVAHGSGRCGEDHARR